MLLAARAGGGGDGAAAVSTVYDVACGHGLVGLLLAYRFPELRVVGVDLSRRAAYDAYLDAWRAAGAAEPGGGGGALPNVSFGCGDFTQLVRASRAPTGATATAAPISPPRANGAHPEHPAVDRSSLVLCVHGCNEANPLAVELARDGGARCLVVPCCLQQRRCLDAASVRLADDVRYAFLCGAMAHAYGAHRVGSIDRRVTPRAIVLQGSS